jgi:signal transduction histidine kinase
MTWNFTTISLFYLLAGLINLIAAVMIWRSTRFDPKLSKLGRVLLFIAGWLVISCFELSAATPQLRLRFLEIADVFNGLVDLTILLFVIDYFEIHPWVKKKWRTLLIGLVGIGILLSATNAFHHLIWIAAIPVEPFAHNLYRYPTGPLFFYGNAVYLAAILLAFALLIYKGVTHTAGERKFVLLLTFSIAFPFSSYLIYVFTDYLYAGTLGWALGYSLSALFTLWIYFNRFQEQIAQQKLALDNKVQELAQEKDEQARLIEQQGRYLAGIYDLILLGNKYLPHETVRQSALQKLVGIMGCDAICLFHSQDFFFVLDAYEGLTDQQSADLALIKHSSLDFSNQGFDSFSSGITAGAVPQVLADMGYQTAAAHQMPGTHNLFLVLWVDSLALSASMWGLVYGMGDGLNIILENARLTHITISEAKSQERKRLARDLHDSVTQSLNSLIFTVETLETGEKNSSLQTEKIFSLLRASALQALKEMRLLLYEYHEHKSRASLLERVQERLELVEKRAGVHYLLESHPDFQFSRFVEEELFYVINESLNNALKHARATRVEVILDCQASHAVLMILDNGIGFDPGYAHGMGLGIPNMVERCQQIGATLEVESDPEKGTIVKVSLPSDERGKE